MWPYGRLSELVAGYDGPDRAVSMARLARSLLSHGKAREAHLWQRRAEAAGNGPRWHTRVCCLIWWPRARTAIRDRAGPGRWSATAGAATGIGARRSRAGARDYQQIVALVDKNKFASAFKVVDDWPEETWGTKLGKDVALLTGVLEYKPSSTATPSTS